ncbi:hypothetical protein [Nocardia brevicatena]|uniref:hypothetical protein n=1 Tax=Nocardia brevicatena TaxID=37327 RepID=UPI00059409C0|nr:hypothetical protein [Nocardia brevicatena]
MSARGEMLKDRQSARIAVEVTEAVRTVAASLDITGVRALRTLLHAGLSAYWPTIKAAPAQQVLAYERTVQQLRQHWDDRSEYSPEPVVAARVRRHENEVAAGLQLCAELSGCQWLEPVESIAACAISVVQGVVLRWLADCDDEAVLVAFDDLVSNLSARAVCA